MRLGESTGQPGDQPLPNAVLRRDLEEVRREQDISAKTLGLLLVALVALVIHLLTSLWAPGNIRHGADS